jgi:hypothetical protein
MPPLTPYTPYTPQPGSPIQTGTTPPAPSQSAPFSRPVSPLQTAGTIDYDWVVRFCYVMIIAPKLLYIAEMLFQSVRHMNSPSFSNTSSILNSGSYAVIQCLIFFILTLFIQGERNYKKVLIAFLISVIALTYVTRYVPLFKFRATGVQNVQTCYTSCKGVTPGSSCDTKCGTGQATFTLPSSTLK